MQTENYIANSNSNSSMSQSNVLSTTTQHLEKKFNSPSPKSSPKSSPKPTNSISNSLSTSLSNSVSSTNTSGTTTPTHNSHYPIQRRRSSVSTAPYTIPFKSYNGLQQSLNNNNNNNNNSSTGSINNNNANNINMNNNQTITGGPIHTHHYPTPTQTPQPTSQQSQNIVNINSCVPMLTREFVVRRISEGETGRLKEELKCEACGKGYKHISSLAKHLWEHTPEWQKTKKLLISKHQQVQLLEAASILCSMTDQSQSSSSSSLSSPPAQSQPQAPPVHGTILRKNRLVSMNGKSFNEENNWIKSGKEKFNNESISVNGINNGKENKLDSLNIDNVKSFNNTTSCLRKDSISKYPPLSSSRRGSLLGSLIKEEDFDAIADSDEEEHEREQELVASSVMQNGKEFSSVI